jgi:nucleotide-binding universal stress UspA family protein
MQVIKKILVAVDQSDYSLPLVQYSHQLALAINAKIILANIYNRRDVAAVQKAISAYDHELYDTLIKENMAQRHKDLDELVQAAGAEETVSEKLIRVGVPYQELLTIIEEEKPDLLVIGTKGRSNLADTVIGSCALKMYRRSPIPMLSLR